MQITHHTAPYRAARIASTAALLLSAALVPAAAQALQMALEEPVNGATYSGVGNIRGWALSTSGIERVVFYLNGDYKGTIPMGGTRRDVAARYPNYPHAEYSGFSLARNYSLLPPGQHTLRVRITDHSGEYREQTAHFTTTRFGEHRFLSDPTQISLDNATIHGSGDQIIIQGMRLAGDSFDTTLAWSPAAQGMRHHTITPAPPREPEEHSDCVTLPFPEEGMRLRWELTGSQDGVSTHTTLATHYREIDHNGLTSHTTSSTTRDNITTRSEGEERQEFLRSDGFLYLTRITTHGSVSRSDRSLAYTSATDYSPAWQTGPAERFCLGQRWHSDAVTATTHTLGTTHTAPSGGSSGEVEQIGEAITVPAGTFTTVRMITHARNEPDSYYREWRDMATGVMVQATFQSAAQQSTRVLTAIHGTTLPTEEL